MKWVYSIALALIIYVSCEKMPQSPKTDKIVDQESLLNLSVSDSTDTLYLSGAKQVLFKVELNGQIFDSCQVKIDGYLLYRRHPSISLYFDSRNYEDGLYHFEYIAYSHLPPDSVRKYCLYFADTLNAPVIIINHAQSRVDLSIPDGADTLYVSGMEQIQFKVELNGQVFDSCQVKIDGLLLIRRHPYISFPIYSKNYADGLHHFEYIAYTHQAPDSVHKYYLYFADTLIAPVIIDNRPAEPISISEAKPVNGKLQIEWEKYQGRHFQSYQVFRGSNYLPSATITDQNVAYWRDPEYIGGATEYRVGIIIADQDVVIGPPQGVDYAIPVLEVMKIDCKKIEFKWTKCPFDSVFYYYDIQRADDGRDEFEAGDRLVRISDVKDTSFIDSALVFGYTIYYRLGLGSRKSRLEGQSKASFFGYEIYQFDNLRYNHQMNLIYLIYGSGPTMVYDASSMELVSSHHVHPVFSEDGQSAYRWIDDTHIASLDPITLATIKEYNIQDIVGENIRVPGQYLGANNNRILLPDVLISWVRIIMRIPFW